MAVQFLITARHSNQEELDIKLLFPITCAYNQIHISPMGLRLSYGLQRLNQYLLFQVLHECALYRFLQALFLQKKRVYLVLKDNVQPIFIAFSDYSYARVGWWPADKNIFAHKLLLCRIGVRYGALKIYFRTKSLYRRCIRNEATVKAAYSL